MVKWDRDSLYLSQNAIPSSDAEGMLCEKFYKFLFEEAKTEYFHFYQNSVVLWKKKSMFI